MADSKARALHPIHLTALGIEAAAPALLAMLLGLALLFGVGFAQPSALHDAAHDTRHALTFPCH
jgi:cobalt transporter subunit CbtB